MPTFGRHALVVVRQVLAEGAGLVDAEDAQVVGEEIELLQRQPDTAFGGMALDVRIELGRGEGAAELVGFQLGHVDAVGGETAHGLVERGGHVAHPEHKAGDDRLILGLGVVRLAGQDQEAGRVVVLVLDIVAQHLEPVDLAGELGRDRRAARIAAIGDLARGAGGIGGGNGRETEFADHLPALAERHGVAAHGFDRFDIGVGMAEQLVLDFQKMLADDVEPGFGQQVMDVRHPARQRILDRNHAERRLAAGNRGKGVLERGTGQRLHVRKHLDAGDMRVGTGLALIGDNPVGLVVHFVPSMMDLARSRSAGVSTPMGTVSTRATSMRMPASSARICSSWRSVSRCERGSRVNMSMTVRR